MARVYRVSRRRMPEIEACWSHDPLFRASQGQIPLQSVPHGRPLVVQDAVVDGVPRTAALHDHVLAQNSLTDRAEPLDGPLRPNVEQVSLQRDTLAMNVLEEMAKQEILAFCVDCGAPVLTGVPG